ncbi:uncharacterized protein conserved in bacteria [Hahella chejuensis KCTC 2396]|uniref:Macrodomain Ori protein n=1 Tax=Hahella chejuensis (strain KCTC 2396) TaxID=349521 RepID=Q2SM44_HAHCH|nr:DUF413 domain-containing protein [Hahella chejuensis]ABC28280.1 uncharacterized protein conserved in bacteria [Hahella chejuensis KCTC 2396]
MNQKDFASSKVFYDTKHFPRGFSRSGFFSKKEADMLERSGYALQELTNGNRKPATPAEEQLLTVLRGERAPGTDIEKVWIKYLKHIRTKRVSYTTGMAFAMSEGGDFTDVETD